MKTRQAALALPALLAVAAGSASAQSSVTVYGSVGTQLVYATGEKKVKALDANSIVTPRLGFSHLHLDRVIVAQGNADSALRLAALGEIDERIQHRPSSADRHAREADGE